MHNTLSYMNTIENLLIIFISNNLNFDLNFFYSMHQVQAHIIIKKKFKIKKVHFLFCPKMVEENIKKFIFQRKVAPLCVNNSRKKEIKTQCHLQITKNKLLLFLMVRQSCHCKLLPFKDDNNKESTPLRFSHCAPKFAEFVFV